MCRRHLNPNPIYEKHLHEAMVAGLTLCPRQVTQSRTKWWTVAGFLFHPCRSRGGVTSRLRRGFEILFTRTPPPARPIEVPMRTCCLLASVIFTASACSSPPAPVADEVPADAVAIVPADFGEAIQGIRSYSGYHVRARLVIRDRETWTGVWLRASGPAPSRPLPQVDFDQHMIIFAAMGLQPSGGYEITIERLYRRGEDIYAVVEERSPGRGCAVTLALTAPVTAALVPRTGGRVHFIERTRVRHCQ